MLFLSPRVAAYGVALLISAALACDLLWMPIQVDDSLGELIDAQRSPSIQASFLGSLGSNAYLRPMRIVQIKALFDLSQQQYYWLVFRGFHALLLVAAVMLFVRAARVTTITDFGAAALAIAVLIGLHTFKGTLQEAFPINHFLEMVVLCLLTLNLAHARSNWAIDAAAAATFVFAALTLESGLLVWVVTASAWLVGWRGISRRGVIVMTVLLAAYLVYRFGSGGTGVPTLAERSSGFVFEVLDPDELQERFGAQPLWFYAYNVASSIGSVLLSEPQSGVFVAVRAWLDERMLPRVTIPLVTSLATTAVLVWSFFRLKPEATSPRSDAPARSDTWRYLAVFAAVLLANAVLSFAYTKDEIMSVAGAFYALAAFAVVRDMLASIGTRPAVAPVVVLLLAALALGWSVRASGVHYVLRSQAIKHQTDWADLPGRWRRQGEWPEDVAEQQLILRLRKDAVGLSLPNTRVDEPDWPGRLWAE
jgi:hypothetical protein